MNEFVDSLCIMNTTYTAGNIDRSKRYIDFTIKTILNNEERIIRFSMRLEHNEKEEIRPAAVFALNERQISKVSDEEYRFRMNLITYQNELFERLKEENGVRLHALFL